MKRLSRQRSIGGNLSGLSLAVALAGLMILLSCLPAPAQAPTPAAPIKIGLLMPGSGPFTVNGQRVTTAVRLFFESKGWQVAGRKIELVREDTEGKPDVGLTKTQKLVERDRVHALIAFITTPGTYAARDYITAQKIPAVVVSGATALVHPGSPMRSPYIFRSYMSLYGTGKALAEWMHGKGGYRKVVLVASNFGGALEPAFAFKTAFGKLGGQVVTEIKPPVGTVDWGPWISQIGAAAANADAVVTVAYGADAIRMVQGWKEAGLKGRVPLYGGEAFVSEMLLPSMGEAAEGVRMIASYCPTLDTAENREFVRLVKGAGQYPAENNHYGWTAARAMWEALNLIGGRAEDREALVQALRQVRYVGPTGAFRYDENNNPIINEFILEVRRVEGEFHGVCLDRVPEVGHPADIPFPPR